MQLEQIKQLSDEQVIDLFQMYQLEWWSQGRKLPDIRLMLEHSDEIVSFCDSNSKRLVAFARILTDYVYRAIIFDVWVKLIKKLKTNQVVKNTRSVKFCSIKLKIIGLNSYNAQYYESGLSRNVSRIFFLAKYGNTSSTFV